MKTLILLTSILLLGNNAKTQEEASDSSKLLLNLFYILDEGWSPGDTYKWPTDETPNYIQIVNNELAFTGRIRGWEFTYLGRVAEGSIKEGDQGERIITFYTNGLDRTLGKIASFELIHWPDGELNVHVFSRLSRGNMMFSAHRANHIEIKAIQDYWAGTF